MRKRTAGVILVWLSAAVLIALTLNREHPNLLAILPPLGLGIIVSAMAWRHRADP